MSKQTKQQLPSFGELIHYEYMGGGHFRDSRIPKPQPAPTIHGDDIISIIKKHGILSPDNVLLVKNDKHMSNIGEEDIDETLREQNENMYGGYYN